MAISKIILDGVTQIDLTQDTVDGDHALIGYTGHSANGTSFRGGYVPVSGGQVIITDTTDSDGGVIRSITTSENPVML